MKFLVGDVVSAVKNQGIHFRFVLAMDLTSFTLIPMPMVVFVPMILLLTA